MTLTISINLDNAAFDAHAPSEIHRILCDYSRKIQDGNLDAGLYDENGNRVGTAKVTED